MEKLDVMLLPLRGLLLEIGNFLPRLGVALAVLLVGWLLAKGFRLAVVKALRALNFHILTERAGIDGFLQQGGTERDTTDWIGTIANALVLIASLIVAFNSLGLTQVTDLLGKVLLFVPRVLVALLVVVFGSYFSRFVANAVQRYFRAAGISDAEILARVARYAVMVFVLLLAIDHLDIGGGLIQQTFLILLAGVVLALALAFGLGARERAAELIERWFPRDSYRAPMTSRPDSAALELIDECTRASLALLQANLTPHGILAASRTERPRRAATPASSGAMPPSA
jgi:flagellar biosynthesis protein FliQ